MISDLRSPPEAALTSDVCPPTSDLSPPASILRGLRICFLAGTLGQGGAERQLFYMAQALKAAGANALVISLTQGEFWESRVAQLGIPVKYAGTSSSRLKRLWTIARTGRAYRPDIIQSQHFYVNGYAGIAARLFRTRAIGALRNHGPSDLNDCGRLCGKLCLALPHLLAVNSLAAIRNLKQLGCREGKMHYLPNVIDLEEFQPIPSWGCEPFTILGIGRLAPQKRFDRFLRVVAMVRQKAGIPIKAVIAGDGPLRSELEQLARTSGLNSSVVEFRGRIPDVQPLLAESNVLLLTSDHEGTPNVVMEAMASGLPVVATAVGDVPDLVQHGTTGFVLAPEGTNGMAAALVRLAQDAELRMNMGRKARLHLEAHHGLNLLPANLARLYASALN